MRSYGNLGISTRLLYAGGKLKKAFFRDAHALFCGTTRVNSGKWEKRAGKRGEQGIPSQFFGISKGLGGTLDGFAAGGDELIWQTNAKKGRFFGSVKYCV